ncbi:MAG: hypothetical protein KIT32_12045 [Rhodocyclaceae bacterium]|nr:hypothetical protein [Rhodocyclaceae bacterium]
MPLDSNLTIELPKLNLQRMEIMLVGDSPLITHKWSEKAKKEMLDKQMKKAKTAKEAKDPERDFQESLYEHPDGGYGFPVIGFKAAAVTACTSVANITKVMARQSFHIDGELAKIIGPAPRKREDMVRIGMGTADIRYRGEFWPWATRLMVIHNANVMSAEQIVNLLNTAGFGVGVGEWRPEKDGQYGRFHVASELEIKKLMEK